VHFRINETLHCWKICLLVSELTFNLWKDLGFEASFRSFTMVQKNTHNSFQKIVRTMGLPGKNSWFVTLLRGICHYIGKILEFLLQGHKVGPYFTGGDRYTLCPTEIKITLRKRKKRSYVILYLSGSLPNIYFHYIYAILCPIFPYFLTLVRACRHSKIWKNRQNCCEDSAHAYNKMPPIREFERTCPLFYTNFEKWPLYLDSASSNSPTYKFQENRSIL